MKFVSQKIGKQGADIQTLVVFVSNKTDKNGDKKSYVANGIQTETKQLLNEAQNDGALSGDYKEVRMYRNAFCEGAKHLLVIGLGDSKDVTLEKIRNASAVALKQLKAQKAKSAGILFESLQKFHKNVGELADAVCLAFELTDYKFDDHRTIGRDKTKKSKDDGLSEITLFVNSKTNVTQVKKGMDSGATLADCMNFAKWLGDQPGNKMTPAILGSEVQKAAKGTKLKVTVWDKARIKKEKMGGLLGVASGSDNDPRFIIMEYKGAAASRKPVCFVGKGLTFDSGGISLKPAPQMDEMRYDMCGGANVIGTLFAIARLGLKINAIGLVPSSENMPGPLANKPGDILTIRNGKTVEVLNTDAEGRLILADALSYASEKKPAAIFDAATLTGAIIVALSNIHTGVFSRDHKLVGKVVDASDKAGELVWPMPLHDCHVEDIKGKYADVSNISHIKGAGSATAAAFLEHFVDSDIPWAHFDIAGTAWNVGGRLEYCPGIGASGSMIRTFVELAKNY